MNSDGAKMPPDPPIPIDRLVASDLPEREDDQEPQRVPAGGGLVHDRVADAVHLRQREQQQPERDPADGGPRPFRTPLPQRVAQVLDLVQHLRERQPHQRGDHREPGDEQVGARVVQRDAGREAGQERLVAEERDRDDVGDHRRQHDGEQRVDRELAQDDLHAEEHPGDRRVERGGDAARGAAGDHDPQPVLRHPHPLADAGGQRRADLHDRALRGPPSRPTRWSAPRRGP